MKRSKKGIRRSREREGERLNEMVNILLPEITVCTCKTLKLRT